MQPSRFDALTRRLATGASRRSVLRSLAAGVLAGVGLAKVAAADKSSKVTLCHQTGSATNPWVLITVAPSAATTLQNNGDKIPNSDGTCGDCLLCPFTGQTTCTPETDCLLIGPPLNGCVSSPESPGACQFSSLSALDASVSDGPYVVTYDGGIMYTWNCVYGQAQCDATGCVCPPAPQG